MSHPFAAAASWKLKLASFASTSRAHHHRRANVLQDRELTTPLQVVFRAGRVLHGGRAKFLPLQHAQVPGAGLEGVFGVRDAANGQSFDGSRRGGGEGRDIGEGREHGDAHLDRSCCLLV